MNAAAPWIACWPLLLLLLGSCGSTQDWRELDAGTRRYDELWGAVEFVARTDGFSPGPKTDRGLGIYESRWRTRTLTLGRAGRHRLQVELVEEEGEGSGWLVRFCVERQKVKELDRSFDPTEDDWSDNGRDGEREDLFGERLLRRLGLNAPILQAQPDR